MNGIKKQSRFELFYNHENHDLLHAIHTIISDRVSTIASTIYAELLTIPESKFYLDNELVETRLKKQLEQWLEILLSPQETPSVKRIVDRQFEIGEIHARIDIPMWLVDHTMFIVKRECFSALIDAGFPCDRLARSIVLVNSLLDESLSCINQRYLDKMVDNERAAQSLRMQYLGGEIAHECERVRTDLFDWLSQALTQLSTSPDDKDINLPNIYHSSFGLWITHKAEFYFPDNQEIQTIKNQIEKIDEIVQRIRSSSTSGNRSERNDSVCHLTDEVKQTSWLLNEVIERIIAQQHNTDPLTKLLNRRFLNGILQRETRISIAHGVRYAILLIDLDNFKRINDNYGHTIGDQVLKETSSILLHNIRSTDFALRYGGEEFMVILTSVDIQTSKQKAESIRKAIERNVFAKDTKTSLHATASIGISIHRGHPDFKPVIEAADAALYEAKNSGKNRCAFRSV